MPLFEVDKILNHRKVGTGHDYLVQWKQFDENTWELESD
jgi:hypothetical protein